MKVFLQVLALSVILIISLGQKSLASELQQTNGLSLEQLKTLAGQLKSTSDFEELSCAESLQPSVKNVYFFDGDRGFCPRYFLFRKPSTAQADFGISAADQFAVTPRTSENEVYFKEIEQELKEEALIRNCLLVKTALTHLKNEIARGASDLHYYSKRGEKEAAACALKDEYALKAARFQHGQIQSLFPRASSPQISSIQVLAYSMGSEAAMRFARLLIPTQLKVDRIQSMDPVGRVVNWTTGVITTEDNSLFDVPANVNAWINYFQKQDHYSLINTPLVHLGIRGSRVIGAKLNHEILAEDFEDEKARRKGHVYILSQPLVLESMAETFR